MTIRKTATTVGTLAQGAVSTAVGVAKHPIGTASMAVGFAKGVAGAGLDLVRGGHSDVQESDVQADEPTSSPASVQETLPVEDDPRDDLPGPDLAEFEPPRPEDLPEPVVIEADDAAGGGVPQRAEGGQPRRRARWPGHGLRGGRGLRRGDPGGPPDGVRPTRTLGRS